jgi:hypothetical protein
VSKAVDSAKATLLRALDELEAAEGELDGTPDRVDLVVVYSIGSEQEGAGWHEIGGWASTAGPKWMHAAMLRRAADAQDDAARAVDDE